MRVLSEHRESKELSAFFSMSSRTLPFYVCSIPFVFIRFRTLFCNGTLANPLQSMACALFPIQWRGCPSRHSSLATLPAGGKSPVFLGPIAARLYWCHNPNWRALGTQARKRALSTQGQMVTESPTPHGLWETSPLPPVSNGRERTSGTARSRSPLQVVPGSIVRRKGSTPERSTDGVERMDRIAGSLPSKQRQAGPEGRIPYWMRVHFRAGKAGSVRLG